MTRRLGRNHGHIHIRRRRDLLEVDVEAVGEHQGLAGGHVGRDLVLVEISLNVVGHQDHDYVRGLGGVRRGHHF